MFYSELGGKSPVFIDDTCNLETAMKRLLWGKMLNMAKSIPKFLKEHLEKFRFYSIIFANYVSSF